MSGGLKSGLRKTKPIYYWLRVMGDMDVNAFFGLLSNLSWVLAMLALGLGFLYVFVKPQEKK
jgi:hypothetical protein